jgi:GTP pyrophosphokinase
MHVNTENIADPSSIISHIWSPSDEDTKLIRKAYDMAVEAHKDQNRHSGRLYVHHVIETAIILADLGMDIKSIVAGLLHDTIEDGHLAAEEVTESFDEEVLFLVQGVTKLGHVRYQGLERHTESLRKLFVATSQDVRVLIIKLADRLHNMRTLQHIPERKQERIATETLEVYAPIAQRLGIGKIYKELQDLSFPFIDPEAYSEVKQLSDEKYDQAVNTIKRLRKKLIVELDKDKQIHDPTVDYRLKHLYSLYQKLKQKDMDIDRIYDIVAMRVIVKNVEECYRVLGIVHGIWRPRPDRMKDYIASPKPNGYQSLHTTIFTGDGSMAEIQIRTEKMHREAEYGVASHVRYKTEERSAVKLKWFDKFISNIRSSNITEDRSIDNVPNWIKEMAEEQENTTDPDEFLKNLQTDFFEDRIFVFSPNGDVIDLPVGSGPIDFAYHIHSQLGDHISGARINQKFSSLDTRLKSGDIVEIITDKSNHPKRKWLDYTQTTLAQSRIKRAIRQQNSDSD